MREPVIGAAAGAAATVPMTWAMELMHRLLPRDEQHPLPPREITDRVTGAEPGQPRDEREQFWLTLASHFGYGAAAGSAYATLARSLPLPPLAKGTAYGLAVWAGSYLGLLPALRVLSTATEHPPRRTALMIAAHAVWGSALGLFAELLEKGSRGEGLQSIGPQNGTGAGVGTPREHHPRETHTLENSFVGN
jgi:uncharacterized membrane protein YagU involved in acid resistance